MLDGNRQLHPLDEQPNERESLLQELLAEFPAPLAGELIDPAAPRRWLLVSREVALGDSEEPLDDFDKRREVATRLEAVHGVKLPSGAVERRPSIAFSVLANPDVLQRVLGVFEWMIAELKQTP